MENVIFSEIGVYDIAIMPNQKATIAKMIDPTNTIADAHRINNLESLDILVIMDKYFEAEKIDNIKAVAICSPEDDFDDETGCKLATARLKKMYHQKRAAQYKGYIKKLNRAISDMSQMVEYHKSKVESQKRNIDYIISKINKKEENEN